MLFKLFPPKLVIFPHFLTISSLAGSPMYKGLATN